MNSDFTPLNVLVVDDDPDAANSMADLLALHGHRSCVALCGREALASVADNPPDAVLLDLRMPGMDGWELAARLNAEPNRPALIAITGCESDADRARSAAAGITFHFVKPIDPNIVLMLLDATARVRALVRGVRPPVAAPPEPLA